MLSIISTIILAIAGAIVLTTVVISFVQKRDFNLLARLFPFIALPWGIIMMATNKSSRLAKALIWGSCWGLLYWFFIIDWYLIYTRSDFVMMGPFYNPLFLFLIALISILLAGGYQLIIKLIYNGWGYIIILMIVALSCIAVLIFSYVLSSDVIDMMFVSLYLILGSCLGLILLTGVYQLIIKLIYNGWPYIKKLMIKIIAIATIVLIAYLLSDGSYDEKYVEYGIDNSKAKFVSIGLTVTYTLIILAIFTGILGNIRTSIMKLK